MTTDLDYVKALEDAGARVIAADAEAALARDAREALMVRAVTHGGLSARTVGGILGVSHSYVARLVRDHAILVAAGHRTTPDGEPGDVRDQAGGY